jgi:hypothetical protein
VVFLHMWSCSCCRANGCQVALSRRSGSSQRSRFWAAADAHRTPCSFLPLTRASQAWFMEGKEGKEFKPNSLYQIMRRLGFFPTMRSSRAGITACAVPCAMHRCLRHCAVLCLCRPCPIARIGEYHAHAHQTPCAPDVTGGLVRVRGQGTGTILRARRYFGGIPTASTRSAAIRKTQATTTTNNSRATA